MTIISNDHLTLTPRTTFDTPAFEFDFPGLEIGIAEYDEGPTGCTVFHFPQSVRTAVDVRGGSAGTVFDYEINHAICFAGGSLLGLEVVAGVYAELFAQRGYSFDDGFPLASGAIIYDFGKRANRIYPDSALGRAALKAARPGIFYSGARGAGRSASCGGTFNDEWTESSGQGAAFRQIGPVKIAVFTVVNCSGSVFDRQNNIVRGNLNPETNQRVHPLSDLQSRLEANAQTINRKGNTVLTLLATNLKLDDAALKQVGQQVHSSMARAIQPFQTIDDGDVLYAVTTDEVEYTSATALGMLASEAAWDAVLNTYKS